VTTLRLAVAGNHKRMHPALQADRDTLPAILISYWYIHGYPLDTYKFRSMALDSGAWSAFNSGAVIDLGEYTNFARDLKAKEPRLEDVFALDVIGDWKAGLKNTEWMWKQGVEALPTFHPGEPWDVLKGLARDYPKIGLGGVVKWPTKRKKEWVEECFSRVWPCKIHGLGMASDEVTNAVPFHSVDVTSWEIAPVAFGNWKTFGGRCSVRGSEQHLTIEIDWYLRRERQLQARWKVQMAKLEGTPPSSPPTGGTTS
jgi:hypothetical protein